MNHFNTSHTQINSHTSQLPVNSSQANGVSKKRALFLTFLLIIIGVFSVLWLFLQDADNERLVADIYQNGECIASIPLATVTETYSFTVTGDHDAVNEIEVRPGSIGILSASCPDKLCVHQGFISNSKLPITCLPNRLVIQVRSDKVAGEITPDIVTY